MMEDLCTSWDRSTAVPKRILSGFFVNDAVQVKRCDLLSPLLAQGYEVLHVGTNVRPALLIKEMKKFTPQVLIFICQGNIGGIKQMIEIVKEENMRSMARIILYGPDVAETVRDEVHADAYADNEQELFDIIEEVMAETVI